MQTVKKIKLKKKNLIIVSLIILVISGIGIVYAFFISKENVENIFKTAAYNIVLEEEFYDDWGTKKVTITNNDAEGTPVVLRINYDEYWFKEVNGTIVNLSNTISTSNGVFRAVTLNTPDDYDTNFINGNDGWFYYTKVLNPNESVILLESISLNEDAIKESSYYEDYKTYDYQLSYNYEAIQATEEAVLKIWGLNIDIYDDGSIIWPF